MNSFTNHHKRIQEPGIAVSGFTPFYQYQNKIRFKEFGVDTLFTVEKDQLTPYAIFDMGKRPLPVDIQVENNEDLVSFFPTMRL